MKSNNSSTMKRIIGVILVVCMLSGLLSAFAGASNKTTSYTSYTAPTSADYAYWSGTKVVKASGTTTSEIMWMQAALNYCIKNLGLSATLLEVDGSFGPASKTACLAFQKKYGLSQDGSFGPSTITKMKQVLSDSKTSNTAFYNYSEPTSSDYAYWSGSKVMKASGTTLSEIMWMQAALNYCIKNLGLSATVLTVDGSFGPASKSACLAFQKKYGLSQDGSFGPSTIAKMKSVLKSNRITVVNSIKDSLFNNAENYRSILKDCYTVSFEIFGTKQFLKTLGTITGTTVTADLKAMAKNVVLNPELWLELVQMDVAGVFVIKAQNTVDKVLSFKGKTLNDTTAIQLLEAYRDCSSYSQAVFGMLNPILDEFAKMANKSKAEQAALLAKYFSDGAKDGLFDAITSSMPDIKGTKDTAEKIKKIDDTIKKLKAVYTACDHTGYTAESALCYLGGYMEYKDMYNRWQNLITLLKA